MSEQFLHGVAAIRDERKRQIEEEGYGAEHDKRHEPEDLALAAMAYLMSAFSWSFGPDEPENVWPWKEGFRPLSPRRDLVRAGALIAAAIDRLGADNGN